jgi:hypothetical protein
MTESVTVPAGWYPDPTGRHQYRYWHGADWTDLVSDAGRTSSDPPVAVLPVPAVSPDEPVPAPDATPPSAAATPSDAATSATAAAAPVAWAPPSGPPVAAPPPPGPPVAAPPPPGVHGMPLPPPGVPFGPLTAQPSPGPRRAWWAVPVAIVAVLLLVAGVGTWVIWTRPGPGPVGLATSTVTARSVSLTWVRPKTDKAPQRYVVRRNGVEITRTTGETTYIDTGLSPLTDYRYQVLAVVDGKLSHPTGELVASTLPESPYGLTSGEVTTTSVVVSWSAPSGPRPDFYVVQRDGADFVTLGGDTLTYRDSALAPKTDVAYAVVAVTKGRHSDPTPTLQVTTLEPPAADARLQHSWDVTLTISKSTSSKAKVGLTDTGNWMFTPRCATGACAVDVSGDVAGRPFSMTLNRSGALYKGSAKAHVARCVNADVSNNLDLTVKVTAGDMSDTTWTASNWTGNLTLSIPYTTVGNYYCPAQTITFAVSPDYVTADPTT